MNSELIALHHIAPIESSYEQRRVHEAHICTNAEQDDENPDIVREAGPAVYVQNWMGEPEHECKLCIALPGYASSAHEAAGRDPEAWRRFGSDVEGGGTQISRRGGRSQRRSSQQLAALFAERVSARVGQRSQSEAPAFTDSKP